MLRTELPEVDFRVNCSKGFYVRTYAFDIGNELGCGAHLSALRRRDETTLDGEAFHQRQHVAGRRRVDAEILVGAAVAGVTHIAGYEANAALGCSQ